MDDVPADGGGNSQQGCVCRLPEGEPRVQHEGPATGRSTRMVAHTLHSPGAGLWS